MQRTRTVAYLRVSTDKQADRGVSLDAQRAKVAAYAELYDLDLVEGASLLCAPVAEVDLVQGCSVLYWNRQALQRHLRNAR